MKRIPKIQSVATENGPGMERCLDGPPSITAEQAEAFSCVWAVAKKLRDIGLEACEAMAAAQATGLDERAILQTLNFEYEDWDKKIPLMLTAHDLLSSVGARTRLDMAVMIDDPIASAEDLEIYHRKQGAKAYSEGKTLHHNPYPASGLDALQWRAGFSAEKNSARRKAANGN